MKNVASSIAGLVFYTPDPQRLERFYAETFGAKFERTSHGTLRPHIEGSFAGIHVAIWDDGQRHAGGAVVPVFRTHDLAFGQQVAMDNGAHRLHAPLNLGEGKRVVSFNDPDGRQFRLIELSHGDD